MATEFDKKGQKNNGNKKSSNADQRIEDGDVIFDKERETQQEYRDRIDSLSLTYKRKVFLSIYAKTLGNMTRAADIMGIHRTTPYKRRQRNPKFAESLDQVLEMQIDFAEDQLFKQMRNGSSASTIFFLKTKAKHRGYVESDVDNKGVFKNYVFSFGMPPSPFIKPEDQESSPKKGPGGVEKQ